MLNPLMLRDLRYSVFVEFDDSSNDSDNEGNNNGDGGSTGPLPLSTTQPGPKRKAIARLSADAAREKFLETTENMEWAHNEMNAVPEQNQNVFKIGKIVLLPFGLDLEPCPVNFFHPNRVHYFLRDYPEDSMLNNLKEKASNNECMVQIEHFSKCKLSAPSPDGGFLISRLWSHKELTKKFEEWFPDVAHFGDMHTLTGGHVSTYTVKRGVCNDLQVLYIILVEQIPEWLVLKWKGAILTSPEPAAPEGDFRELRGSEGVEGQT
ncbi:hypothetical protein P691DRAFT_786035 [Macrolepiota fuliginosa MF-IS2]|uniref:Uncharacterized protein n=1 Tax=Macrolepiota fuliginosa MF-IS2 TaxID=1400762 RepID=A0A9P5X811_9AGAR|nr:hypothetical protein P691DRAFT_786035 [Macrolepiota fuliginosa MF-IS2]